MPCKRFRRAILKCRECRPEAKTTSMSVKTKTMYIKTKALIDKFAALFCVFSDLLCIFVPKSGNNKQKLCTQSISKGKYLT